MTEQPKGSRCVLGSRATTHSTPSAKRSLPSPGGPGSFGGATAAGCRQALASASNKRDAISAPVGYSLAAIAPPKSATQKQIAGPKTPIKSISSRIAVLVQSCPAAPDSADAIPGSRARAHGRWGWIASSSRSLQWRHMPSRSRGAPGPRLTGKSRPSVEQRARGMPGAQCTRSLVCAQG